MTFVLFGLFFGISTVQRGECLVNPAYFVLYDG